MYRLPDRLCICLYLSKTSDSDDGIWHALWSHRPSKFRGKTLFLHLPLHFTHFEVKGGLFTPPHFISVQDESINLSLFNWASPLARSASAQEDFDPFWLDPARTQSSSSMEPLTRFGFIHIQTLPVWAMLCTSVWRRLVLTWTVSLGRSFDTY